MDKYSRTVELLHAVLGTKEFTLLDVGCRDCVLHRFLPSGCRYTGMDLFQNEAQSVSVVGDVEKGIPFGDAAFDAVVALDLVEHLNDFDRGVEELFRVVKKTLIINLPNVAHAAFRWRFFTSGELSGKYRLQFPNSLDRHRWLTKPSSSKSYFDAFAAKNNARVSHFDEVDSVKKERLARGLRLLGLSSDWWAWSTLHVLEKR